jgi:ribonuclease T1
MRQQLEVLCLFRYHLGFSIQGLPVSSSGQSPRWQALRQLGLAAVVAGASLAGAMLPNEALQAKESVSSRVSLTELPPEAVKTYRLILSGGPFPYSKDGSVFGNRERQLPAQVRGFYREYTVKTPGASNRGARRIICGGKTPAAPEACYYTADHYASFRRIVE